MSEQKLEKPIPCELCKKGMATGRLKLDNYNVCGYCYNYAVERSL